jgi:hypothetical protein
MPDPPRPPFTWDATSARYRDARGHFMRPPDVRSAVEAVIAGSSSRMARLSSQLNHGRIDLATWQTQMAHEIKILHLAQLAAGAGGWHQLTAADFGTAGQILRTQYGWLARFTADIASGALSPAQIAARARSYADAGRATYEGARLRRERVAGYTQERNILHAAEHCSLCLSETGRGWVPIGALVPIGSRQCRTHDQCSIERR